METSWGPRRVRPEAVTLPRVTALARRLGPADPYYDAPMKTLQLALAPILAVLLALLPLDRATSPLEQDGPPTAIDELAPLTGPVVLASHGSIDGVIAETFVELAGGGSAHIVTLGGYQSEPGSGSLDWLAAGAGSSSFLRAKSAERLLTEEHMLDLLSADGIWIAGFSPYGFEEPWFRALLRAANERGVAIGAAGQVTRRLTGMVDRETGSALFVPRIHLEFGEADPGRSDAHHKVARRMPGEIVAAMPDSTAIVVHGGRRVALLGAGDVGFAVYRADGTMVDEQVLPCQAERSVGDPLEYRLDLLAWIRQARDAERPIFPPLEPAAPRIPAGTLIVQGGGGVTEGTWERFIELAGGRDANFVCIPSANTEIDAVAPRSYSARELAELGCTNVRTVHAHERHRAQHDEHLIAAIDAADAVWIDGGRTFMFMDRFGETAAAEAIARVLERGQVVGGSSAGCQVVGELLLRGDPKTNSEILYPGYTRGLGLIEGIVFDAHFRERERYGAFRDVVHQYPQLLGIGVDAETALLIQGTTAEVLGENGVNVYDARSGGELAEEGVAFEAGATFDLSDPASATTSR